MKKYILSILIFIMFIPVIVKAETCDTDKITITSISIENKSSNVEELNNATVNGKNINLNLSMSEVGDNIKYKIVVKNDSNEDYMIDKKNININSEYIEYTIESDDNSNIVKAKSSKTVQLKVQYKNEVPEDQFESGTFNYNKNLSLNLSTTDLNNPKTGVKSVLFIFIIFLISSILIFAIIRKRKYAKLMILIIGIVFIPMSVYAICKVEVSISSNVKIEKKNKVEYIVNTIINNDDIDNYELYKIKDNPSCVSIKNTNYSSCIIVAKKEYHNLNEKVNVLDHYTIGSIDNIGNYHSYNISTEHGQIHKVWYPRYIGDEVISEEKNISFFWGYFKFTYDIEQEFLEFYDYYNDHWYLPDSEGPAIEFGSSAYFYMPNHDVIIMQFLGIKD